MFTSIQPMFHKWNMRGFTPYHMKNQNSLKLTIIQPIMSHICNRQSFLPSFCMLGLIWVKKKQKHQKNENNIQWHVTPVMNAQKNTN